MGGKMALGKLLCAFAALRLLAWLRLRCLQEVGVDVREHDEADALDPDDDVAVLPYALHEAFVAFEGSAGDAYALVLPEVFLGEDFAAGGVAGCEQAKKVNRRPGDDLHRAVSGIAVDPEGGQFLGVLAGTAFEGEEPVGGGPDEEHAGDDGSLAPALAGDGHPLLGEEHLVAERLEQFFGTEVPARLYGEPLGGFLRGRVHGGRCFVATGNAGTRRLGGLLWVHVWIWFFFLRHALRGEPHHSDNRPSAVASDP